MLPVTWVRSNAGAALDRSVQDREVCTQSRVTTLEVPRRKSEAMAARATWALLADEAGARSWVLRSGASALDASGAILSTGRSGLDRT